MTPADVQDAKARADLVPAYADAIRRQTCQEPPEPTDWAAVNGAILARWSRAGLIWIKRQAWKRVQP